MARIRTMGVVILAVAMFGAFAARGSAQEPPSITLPPLSTTTTAPAGSGGGGSGGGGGGGAGSSSTTAPSGTSSSGAPPTTADVSHDGDNGSPTGGGAGQTVPPDAQAILNSIVRSTANDDHLLVAGEKALLAAGVDPDQAARLAYGRF